MRRLGLVVSLLVASSALVALDASPAAACSCAPLTAEQAFDVADAVFVGDWVETLPGGALAGVDGASDDPTRLIFEVDGVYKGEVFARQSVVTARDGASCGLELRGEGPFLVFGRTAASEFEPEVEAGELSANQCGGSRAVADGAVPASFGPPSAPVEGSSPVGGSDGVGAIVAMAVGGALAGAAVLGVRAIRGRRPPSPPG
ncbi:MAG: hypothetical protein MUE36_14205 [Acidimicrobiales bacterium]|nr:hypothetical protein [Acidimicrobiales bacterium]